MIGLFMGFGSMATGLKNESEGKEPAVFDVNAWPAATLPLVFDIAATAGPAALVPGVFVIAFAALSVVLAFRMRVSFAGRPGPAPFEDEVKVVTLSEEFFAKYFVGDTVNLAGLSNAVNVSQEFLACYVFEHGFGQLVAEIQAAAAAIDCL